MALAGSATQGSSPPEGWKSTVQQPEDSTQAARGDDEGSDEEAMDDGDDDGEEDDDEDDEEGGRSAEARRRTPRDGRRPMSRKRAESAKRRQTDLAQWLEANFEPFPNTSLPRNSLFEAYERHSSEREHGEYNEPINTASFGKIIRSTFPTIQTRRLGVRGQSRYYYHGIRVIPTSELANVPNLQTVVRSDDSYRSRTMTVSSTGSDVKESPAHSRRHGSAGKAGRNASAGGRVSLPTAPIKLPTLASIPDVMAGDISSPDQTGGTGTEAVALAEFGDLSAAACAPHDPTRFVSLYRSHSERLFRSAQENNFVEFQNTMNHFWATLPTRMLPLLDLEVVLVYVRDCDTIFYSGLLSMLVPDFLKSAPLEVGHPARVFAKQVENATLHAIQGMPHPSLRLQATKFEVARAFALALQRLASLNHLARAARTVLKNALQMDQLLGDWDSIDLGAVHDAVARVCGCSAALMSELEGHVVQMLAKASALEDWTTFLSDIYTHCVLSQPFTNAAQLSDVSHQFHLRWSFYCCTIVRDLTLRSATSFGSYHLMRLFFDDYMLFLADDRFVKQRLVELRGIHSDALLRAAHPVMVMSFATLGSLDAFASGTLTATAAVGSSPSPTTDAAIDLAQLAYSGNANTPSKFRRNPELNLIGSPADYSSLQYNLSPPHGFVGSMMYNGALASPTRHAPLGGFGETPVSAYRTASTVVNAAKAAAASAQSAASLGASSAHPGPAADASDDGRGGKLGAAYGKGRTRAAAHGGKSGSG